MFPLFHNLKVYLLISKSLSFTWKENSGECWCKHSKPTTSTNGNAISGIFNCASDETNASELKNKGYYNNICN